MINQQIPLHPRWRTVKVFISSTFRDMYAERDHLIKVVFPALREKLGKYRVYLIDIDLRWGVTKEQADNDQVLDLCLDLIEDCRPFFIGILGERYGWIPKKIPAEAIRKYGWVQKATDKSLTELEILHGVLNNPEMNGHAFFYFRDPDALSKIPKLLKDIYVESDPDLTKNLVDLKRRIKQSGHPVMDPYPARWDAEAYDRYTKAKGRFAGLKEFGDRIQEQLWESIKAKLELPDKPPTETETDPIEIEKDYHRRFIELRLNVYVGREKIHKDLLAYLDGADSAPLIVTGASGSGKSAILAHLSREIVDKNIATLVIPFFIGASPSSTTLRSALQYLCNVIKKEFDLAAEVPTEADKLITTFRSFLFSIPENKKLVLIIDAVNQFDETAHPEELAWLPEELAPNVRLVLSCIDEPGHKNRFMERAREIMITEKRVDALTDDERMEIIRKVPSVSAKTLDKDQIRMLLENLATKNPLYLLIALEELRGFGSFEELNRRISEFPKPDDKDGDVIQAIFGQVIRRLEEDFDKELVSTVLPLLASARRGLSEKEMTELIVDLAGKDDLFPVLRQLRTYLMERGEIIDFFHRGLYKAIHSMYLKDDENKKAYHLKLADYFEKKELDNRKVDELPWQLKKSNARVKLKHTLLDFPLFLIIDKTELMNYWLWLEQADLIGQHYIKSFDQWSSIQKSKDIIQGLFILSSFLCDAVIFKEATLLAQRILSFCQVFLDENHPTVAAALNNLTLRMIATKMYKEAELLIQQALDIDINNNRDNTMQYATHLNNQSSVYYYKKDLVKAEVLIREALEIDRKYGGENHPNVARDLMNLGLLLQKSKRYAEAETAMQKALLINKFAYGENHPNVASNLMNLGSLFHDDKRYEEAEAVMRKALIIDDAVYVKGHPTYAHDLREFVALLMILNRFSEAEEFVEMHPWVETVVP
jgi:nephrocystin-3